MKINTTINDTKVTLLPVNRGERTTEVRLANGIEINSQVSITWIGEDKDFDDIADYSHANPLTAAALVAAGVDMKNMVALIEVRLS